MRYICGFEAYRLRLRTIQVDLQPAMSTGPYIVHCVVRGTNLWWATRENMWISRYGTRPPYRDR